MFADSNPDYSLPLPPHTMSVEECNDVINQSGLLDIELTFRDFPGYAGEFNYIKVLSALAEETRAVLRKI